MLAFLGECIADALAGQALNRLDLEDVERFELEQGLLRDLGEFVRSEAEAELPLVPRRFEVSFGTERSAPELQAGLDLGSLSVSGKIDRIDLDPFSARGIVQDYKSGKTAHSAVQIESEIRLQIPLYMLVLRDLLGVEPIGGLYRALAGERKARGLLRAEARDDGVPGFALARLSRRRRLLVGDRRRRRPGARDRRADSGRGRRARSQGRLSLSLVV